MAGSRDSSIRMVRKLPRQLVRNISIWLTMLGVCSLLVQPVAKIPCQKSVIFSCSGRSVFSIL